MRIFEAFAGIGTQNMALKKMGVKTEVIGMSEWFIEAILAYGAIHYNGDIDVKTSIEEKKIFLELLTLSKDSSTPAKTLSNLSVDVIDRLYTYCKVFKNFGSIHNVGGKDLVDIDILTYSFPCTDLSTGGKGEGFKKGGKTRSGLLWEVERILFECHELENNLPKILLMENVPPILSETHVADFEEWKKFLSSLGYKNYCYTLKGSDYGVAQKRNRVFLISTLKEVKIDFNKYLKKPVHAQEILKLDYTSPIYLSEAMDASVRCTPSRVKMWNTNGRSITEEKPFNTITTNMDRQNNAGMIKFAHGEVDKPYRLLTAREAWILMGISEEDYEKVVDELNFSYRKMIKLAGNAIIVDILEMIFREVLNNYE